MISKNQMMDVLLDACPSFRPAWETFLEDWKGEADALPLYLALGDFARHLIAMLAASETATFPAIFEAVERLIIKGDHYVAEAAVIGLLESLQNLNLHSTTGPAQFECFLGPRSTAEWQDLDRFWGGGGTPRGHSG